MTILIYLISGHHRGYINNEMTTPKSVHDVTHPTENLVGFILSDLLQIVMVTWKTRTVSVVIIAAHSIKVLSESKRYRL